MKLTLKYVEYNDEGDEIGTKDMPIETRTMTMKMRDELDNASARYIADCAKIDEANAEGTAKGAALSSKNNRYYRYMIDYIKIITNRTKLSVNDLALFLSAVEETDGFWLNQVDMRHLAAEIARFRDAPE